MEDLRRPGTPLLRILTPILALAAGYFVWSYLATSRPDGETVAELLAETDVELAHVRELELGWLDEVFEEQYVVAPLGPLPCPEGLRTVPSDQRNTVQRAIERANLGDRDAAVEALIRQADKTPDAWLPALTLAHLLVREGRYPLALEVLDRGVTAKSTTTNFTQILDAARNNPSRGPDSEIVWGILHLYYTSGHLRLEQGVDDPELWRGLKQAIGCCELLSRRGGLTSLRALSCSFELALRAPGCATTSELTSYDLYNNLLVGYLQRPFKADETRRQKEFDERTYTDDPDVNPLQAVLTQARTSWGTAEYERRENWLWAISNAETLMRNAGQKPPADARLSFHLAQLLDGARDDCPPEALRALERQRDELLETARSHLGTVGDAEDRQRLARGLARLEWITAIRHGKAAKPAFDPKVLTREQEGVLSALDYTFDLRSEVIDLVPEIVSGHPGSELRQRLQQRAEAWLAAARLDIASALAMGDDPSFRRLWAAWRLLDPADEPPPQLARHGTLTRALFAARGSAWGKIALPAVAILAAGIVAVVGLLLQLQARRRKELFASFYRREALARTGEPP